MVLMGFLAVLFILFFSLWISARRDRRAPKVIRRAIVLDKRVRLENDSPSEDYFFTCEYENGEREELEVDESEYGIIVVGDTVNVIRQRKMLRVERVVS
ncbi:DUF2500 domain-containing protein [Paenibacillus polymyxa]|uniref:DUF2500 family protein n=1 Tax=Paenibacillus TaxID=44249 RepID=UPI00046F44F0|nr:MULTISPECIES: DUF2500 family protein [Paenibacillus]APB70890.1 DUF2500 domain-containing protein [Paenibacillus polymyxa]OMF39774.1 hypothetical protein BK135_25055 [Paenibacillus peoriae]